jgi:hypothetical protein
VQKSIAQVRLRSWDFRKRKVIVPRGGLNMAMKGRGLSGFSDESVLLLTIQKLGSMK